MHSTMSRGSLLASWLAMLPLNNGDFDEDKNEDVDAVGDDDIDEDNGADLSMFTLWQIGSSKS